MLKTIYSKFDKKKINSLPRVTFKGKIVVILSENEADAAVEYLLSQPVLGIDTETRPAFAKGKSYKVGLLQVSTMDTCFLFRLNHIGLTPSIIKLLEDENVMKVGLSLHDDLLMLRRRKEFAPGNFCDLQKFVKNIGIEDLSLQKIYANVFGEKMSKAQRLTNWDAQVLTDAQKLYAATDAWACVMLYEEIVRLMESKEYELIKVKDEENISKEG